MSSAATGAAAGSGKIRLLVLRAWPDVPYLRARVVEIAPGRVERRVVATTSIDEACRVVRNWLEKVQAEGAG
jgi:hypothetical protein